MTPLLVDFIHQCADLGADPDVVEAMLGKNPDAERDYYELLEEMSGSCIDAMGGFVYRLPVLSPDNCDAIAQAAASYDFTPNLQEQPDYRINEAMLEVVDKGLYDLLTEHMMPLLNAYCLIINSCPITKVESLQIAKYNPTETAGTGWHHDKVSDFTCVVSLNPDDFEGGGTGVRLAPNLSVDVAPLQKGYGLIFNGRSVQHRGLPVTAGERLLLVCWCSTTQEMP